MEDLDARLSRLGDGPPNEIIATLLNSIANFLWGAKTRPRG